MGRPVSPETDVSTGYYTVGDRVVDNKAPPGPIEQRWDTRKFQARLISPANRRELSVIIVGTGLAGASAAATLGEAGYQVTSFCYQDSPRRAHSDRRAGRDQRGEELPQRRRLHLPAVLRHRQGRRLPRPRSPTSTGWRRSACEIIDQCVAQGVPFAREYGGLLDNRSFGGVQVSRTFYARGQTGQQLLLGAYQALERQIAAGTVDDARPSRDARADRRRRQGARGGRPRHGDRRDRNPFRRRRRAGHRRLRQRVSSCPPTRWAATSPPPGARTARARYFANPCFTQIHPTCIPVSAASTSPS